MRTMQWVGALAIAGIAVPAWAAAPEKRVCVEVVLEDTSALPKALKAKPADNTPASQEKAEGQAPAAPAPAAPAAEPAKEERLPWEKESTDRPNPWQDETPKPAADKKEKPEVTNSSKAFLPIGQTPLVYMRRLIEHFVTHEVGYEAVEQDCQETIRVELYPLQEGWTVFARYSGNGREERVDHLFPDELSQFAERAALALLYDVPISSTINRENVLRADSLKSVQRIKGSNHFIVGLGTQLRAGKLPTSTGDLGGTEEQWRLFSPMTLSAGYRGKFENWGIEAITQLGIGTSRTGIRENSLGGHVDLGGDFGVALHFQRYINPRGLTSFYLGAGATFELLWFSAIIPETERGSDSRDTLLSGGLDVDLVFGFEFMRASSVQFFLQGEVQLPAYVIETEDDYQASIRTWYPALGVKLGVMF